MSSSLRINLNSSTSGLTTLYFIMGVDRQFALADGSALEDYDAAHWPSYAIPATEVGAGTGMYFATIPAGLPRNNYWVDCYLRVGGSGMETYTDTHQGPGAVSWDGAAEVGVGQFDSNGAAILTSAYDAAKSAAAPGAAMTLSSGERTALAAAIWSVATSALTAAGSVGKWMLDTLLMRTTWTDDRATKLDNLDATISSRSTFAGGAVASVTDPVALTAVERNAVADAILGRSIAEAEATANAKSLATVVLAIANKSNTEDNDGFLTIYRTDGETEHARIPISTDPNAEPIDGVG